MNNKIMNYQSLLIVTYGRTGSTLLQGLLNTIQGVVIRGENLNFCKGLYVSYKALENIKKIENIGLNETNPFFGAEYFSEEKYFADARLMVLNQLLPIEKEFVQCWGFKEIRYKPEDLKLDGKYILSDYLYFLAKLMPNPLLIFLTRNHQDVIKSAFWAAKDVSYSLNQIESFEYAAKEWAHGRSDCFWITYEEIISNSDRLKELYNCLGAPYDKNIVQNILRIEHSYGNNPENLARTKKLVP